MTCVCRSLAACQRHTPSSLAAVIGLFNKDVISLRSSRCVRIALDGNPALSLVRCQHTAGRINEDQGRRNRSGRPGGCRTNNLTNTNFMFTLYQLS